MIFPLLVIIAFAFFLNEDFLFYNLMTLFAHYFCTIIMKVNVIIHFPFISFEKKIVFFIFFSKFFSEKLYSKPAGFLKVWIRVSTPSTEAFLLCSAKWLLWLRIASAVVIMFPQFRQSNSLATKTLE
jgi:hypothetical protein